MNLCDRKVLTRLDIIFKEQSCDVFCHYKSYLGLIESFSHHFSLLCYSELDHFCGIQIDFLNNVRFFNYAFTVNGDWSFSSFQRYVKVSK